MRTLKRAIASAAIVAATAAPALAGGGGSTMPVDGFGALLMQALRIGFKSLIGS